MNALTCSLLLAVLTLSATAAPIDIPGPAGSGAFGTTVSVLPNGNIVVTDPLFDQVSPAVANVGAVYLYSPDGVLISTLTGSTAENQVGSGGVVILSNGNFVVRSPLWDNGGATDAGAVTWGSKSMGFGASAVVVSAANSIVGSTLNDGVGSVTPLTNGHYVVVTPVWNNGGTVDVGAVTWGNGFTGTSGAISAANSLIGGTAVDSVGYNGVTPLLNGNYVVASAFWDNTAPAAVNAGAATWCDGNGATVGLVSAANSLVGGSLDDRIGEHGVEALTNGNYVVQSGFWNSTVPAITDAGAATWGNGVTGTSGLVSTANSLVGATASSFVGYPIVVALNNGNYVVNSAFWDNGAIADAGAVTWGNGTTGTTGPVSASNSLIGSSASDQVGDPGVTALTNGNYVVCSMSWNNPATAVADVGAATWGNGTTGVSGVISVANSLIGSTGSDQVSSQKAVALTNGNYVVNSAAWNNAATLAGGAGAVTWGKGSTGVKGIVSAANSLVGTSVNDHVGFPSVVALTNGNYVVASYFWTNGAAASAGAATWGNGTTGIKGAVSVANSLVGTVANSNVGDPGILTLTNGNYVVLSRGWDSPAPAVADVGAATWGNGTTGIKGPISAANSLVGSSTTDGIGSQGAVALPNGNYVICSPLWDNTMQSAADAGAVTWGNGTAGVVGPVSATNSLVGSSTTDNVGFPDVVFANDSTYFVRSQNWDNTSPVATNAGAVTMGDGAIGIVGLINSTNSVLGTFATGGASFTATVGYDSVKHQLATGRKDSNLVSLLRQTQMRSLAKTNLDAPGALDIAFAAVGTAAVNASGGVLVDYTLTGSGSAGGSNRALFNASNLDPLDLLIRTADPLSGSNLPSDTKIKTLFSPITQQTGRDLFQSTITGTGIASGNNQLLMLRTDAGIYLLLGTGGAIPVLGNATLSTFGEVLQSHDRDLIAVSYQLKASTTPLVTASNDSGLLLLTHTGNIKPNIAAREGSSAFGGGTFAAFTGRAVAGQGSTLHFSAAVKPPSGATVGALFRMTEDGVTTGRTATVGDNAFGTVQPGDLPAKFASFPGLTQIGSDALFKATLSGCPATANEALFRSDGTRLLRKGNDVDAVNLPGVKFGSISRFWPAGPNQVIAQTTLTGTGVNGTNNQALILRQADGSHLVLLRTGTGAPGCGPVKLAAISAVDVNPVTGRYTAIGTLSGGLASENQALWTGNPTLGNDTALRVLRQPILRLRKGQIYSTENTPQSLVRSLTLKPATDTTGAGGRGLAQCIGANGDVAVYILGDRSLTELVMLPP